MVAPEGWGSDMRTSYLADVGPWFAPDVEGDSSSWASYPSTATPPRDYSREADSDLDFGPEHSDVSQMIVDAAKRGDPLEAGRLLMTAAQAGRVPTQEDYHAVIIGCMNIADLDRAEGWLNLLDVAGGVATSELIRSMFDVVWSRRRSEGWPVTPKIASGWFLRLYLDRKLTLSSGIVMRILACLTKAAEAEEVEMWVQALAQMGVELTQTMLELVVNACVCAGQDERAMRWAQLAFALCIRTLRENGGLDNPEALGRSGVALSDNFVHVLRSAGGPMEEQGTGAAVPSGEAHHVSYTPQGFEIASTGGSMWEDVVLPEDAGLCGLALCSGVNCDGSVLEP